jgi:hypothetical protein
MSSTPLSTSVHSRSSHPTGSSPNAQLGRCKFDLVCDIAVRDRGIFSNYTYPNYITDELLKLLGNMVEGHATLRPHIDDAVQEPQNVLWRHGDQDLRVRALRTILDHRSS